MMQNNDNKIDQLNAIPKKLLSLFSKAIAKLLLKFNINKHEYNHCLNEQLVLEAQRQNPKASKVELSVRTGIHRRYIASYLRGEVPLPKTNKLTLILSDMKWTLNKFYAGSNKMPKKGHFRSFQSICQQWSSGTLTYNAILQELVRIGSIKDHGDKVELLEAKHDKLKNDVQHFELSSYLINRASKTLIHNSETENNTDQYFQMFAYSTQVPPENIKEVKQEIKQELKKFLNNTLKVLDKHEADVEPDTYPAYGVSFLEFNDDEVTK
ncbi:MAG: hypothetical protein L3J83_11400 [Proteobacteria bacterium]|nr:hypothetical protein [Pseudomonadota bacterium]